MSLYIVDCEAPLLVGSPAVGDMTEFGAVQVSTLSTFHGTDHRRETFESFRGWVASTNDKGRPVLVSDNPAYDWQWINFYMWRYFGGNPFGFSARRIGDFYAGLQGDFFARQHWRRLRKTPHDHNPVNDAMGNAEALRHLLGVK